MASRRLVLVSTAAGAIMVPAHPKILAKIVTHKRYRDPDYLESVAAELYGGTMRHDPDIAANALRSTGREHGARGYLLQLAAGAGWTSAFFLPMLRERTLVLSGDDDPLIPKVNAFILGGLIRRSQVNIFNGGHLHLVTEAPEMAPVVEEFLDQPPARARRPKMAFME